MAAAYHACALSTGGAVKCWGNNSTSNYLGIGVSGGTRLTPVDVVGMGSGIKSISGGTVHSCAVTTSGGLKCWGNNSLGQLGDGTTTSRVVAVDVAGYSQGVVDVKVGDNFACAGLTSTEVKCWGSGTLGKLGNGGTSNSGAPVDVVQ